MSWKHSAAFIPSNHGSFDVFCVDDLNGDRFCLGSLDPAKDFSYEGEYVFRLDIARIMEELGESVHIPINVLKQIAEFPSVVDTQKGDIGSQVAIAERRTREEPASLVRDHRNSCFSIHPVLTRCRATRWDVMSFARDNGDAKAMIAKVLSIYRPQEFAVPPGHNVPAAGGLSVTASDQAR